MAFRETKSDTIYPSMDQVFFICVRSWVPIERSPTGQCRSPLSLPWLAGVHMPGTTVFLSVIRGSGFKAIVEPEGAVFAFAHAIMAARSTGTVLWHAHAVAACTRPIFKKE
jgi:hypothetical protein